MLYELIIYLRKVSNLVAFNKFIVFESSCGA